MADSVDLTIQSDNEQNAIPSDNEQNTVSNNTEPNTLSDTKQLDEYLTKQHPTFKLLSKEKLYSAIKSLGTITVSRAIVTEYTQSKELHQIYKRPKKPKLFYRINGPPYAFQVDQIMLPQYGSENSNITQFLLLVDILSRKAYAYTLENNSVDTVMSKVQLWHDSLDHKPISIAGDAFYDNEKVKAWCEDKNIRLFTSIAKDDHLLNVGNKLGIVDRCTRTIKDLITKYMLANNNAAWTTYLDTIIDTYNNTPHRSLKNKAPSSAFEDIAYLQKIYSENYEHNKKVKSQLEVKVGDKVRVLVEKMNFAKEKARYSTQIYEIVESVGNVFKLQGEDGICLERYYKFQEMIKLEQMPVERIETAQVHKAVALTGHKRRLEQEDMTSNDLIDLPRNVEELMQDAPRTKRVHRHDKPWWQR